MSLHNYFIHLEVCTTGYDSYPRHLVQAETLQDAVTAAICAEAYCALGKGLTFNTGSPSATDDYGTRDILYVSYVEVPNEDYAILVKYLPNLTGSVAED